MAPTLKAGNYILTSTKKNDLNNLQQGDVIVFFRSNQNQTYYVKRIAAIPEDSIEILKGKLIVAAAISVPNIIVMNPTLIPSLSDRFPAGTYGEGLAWSIMALISVPVFLWAGSLSLWALHFSQRCYMSSS